MTLRIYKSYAFLVAGKYNIVLIAGATASAVGALLVIVVTVFVAFYSCRRHKMRKSESTIRRKCKNTYNCH